MERITIYPNEELLEKIDKESKEQNRSKNNMIINILNNYFKNK